VCSLKLPVALALIALSTFLLTNADRPDAEKHLKEISINNLQENSKASNIFSDIIDKLSDVLVNKNLGNAYAKNLNYGNNDLPYLLEHVNSLENGSVYVQNGLIILDKSKPTNLQFAPWGQINTLQMGNITKYDSNFYIITGTSGNASSGFASQNLNYQGNYVSLMVGNIQKSQPSQTAFSISVTGKNGNYFLIFVNGPLSTIGWRGNNYYEPIGPNSSRLIDLKSLIALRNDDYSSVNKISIVLQKNVTSLLEFRIDLNRTTENAPVLLPLGNSYYVVGDIRKYSEASQSNIVFHNLELLKTINLEYLTSVNYRIVENHWQIIESNTSSDTQLGVTHIVLTAQKPINSQEFFQDVLSLDVYKSLSDLGEKDILLLSVLSGLFVLFLGWKFFWSDKHVINKND
jgi:hypothetical protein